MAKIEGLRIKNFKVLKDVTLGRLWNQPNSQPLTPMTAVIGKNGVGKSALFDAFGFLADALKLGVEEACDARGRGGFEKMRTQGQTAPSGSRYTTESIETLGLLPTRSLLKRTSPDVPMYCENASDKGGETRNTVGRFRFYGWMAVEAWHGKERKAIRKRT